MRDPEYYKKCSTFGNYVVGRYQHLIYNDLLICDYETLSGKEWLTDAIMNFSINSFIRGSDQNNFVMIAVEKSFAIFNMNLEDSFFEDLPTT